MTQYRPANSEGVTCKVIDRIFDASSKELDIVSEEEAIELFGELTPYYDEWLTAKCGKLSSEEGKIARSFYSLQAALATYEALQDPNFPKSDDFGSNINELMDDAQLAISMHENGILDGYVERIEEINSCRKKSAKTHIKRFHYTAQLNFENILDIYEGNNSPENWKLSEKK